jgi:hypothetical protein
MAVQQPTVFEYIADSHQKSLYAHGRTSSVIAAPYPDLVLSTSNQDHLAEASEVFQHTGTIGGGGALPPPRDFR